MKDPHGLPKGLLRGLQAEHLVIRRAAVEEAFRFLGEHSTFQSRDGAALLQQCISASDAVSLWARQQQSCKGISLCGLMRFTNCAWCRPQWRRLSGSWLHLFQDQVRSLGALP